MNKKVSVARLSILSNTVLIAMKLVVGIITGSVSIVSEAIHSTMDLVAAVIAYFSVRVSDNPPDAKHPYGHGKVENVSGVIEALLIFAAAFWIVYEAVNKIMENEPVESIGIGFVVMFVSAGVNILVSMRLYKVAKETGSVALEADALHLKTDVYTSAGVGMGLLLIWITGLNYLDPVVAILVALFILFEAYKMLRNAFSPLLDASLSEEEVLTIKNVIEEHHGRYHNLRTRRSGNYRFVDFHLEVAADVPVGEAHALCDDIENDIRNRFNNTEVTIHVETVGG